MLSDSGSAGLSVVSAASLGARPWASSATPSPAAVALIDGVPRVRRFDCLLESLTGRGGRWRGREDVMQPSTAARPDLGPVPSRVFLWEHQRAAEYALVVGLHVLGREVRDVLRKLRLLVRRVGVLQRFELSSR